MPDLLEEMKVTKGEIERVASAMAVARREYGNGATPAVCVRLSDSVRSLLEAAKPENQKMPEFLREAALIVALKRLEESQN